MKYIHKILLSEWVIMTLIVINAIVIYLQTTGFDWAWLTWVDAVCTLVFVFEMIAKHREYGVRGYWSDGWNRMDGALVILSLPSILTPFLSLGTGFGVLLSLRLLRVLKSFRVMRFFPNFGEIMKGVRLAMSKTWAVLASFAVIIFIFALINCTLFGEAAPEYFGTPSEAFYSVFRLFTVEGWYDIPDAITAVHPGYRIAIRVYFCLLLIVGGILGMSIINSIFVDAMVADNNDDVKYQLDNIEKRLDEISRKLEGMK